MGVKTALNGITLTGTDITTAEAKGIDVKGMMALAATQAEQLSDLLNVIVTEVLTPASDAGNITTVNAQITALS